MDDELPFGMPGGSRDEEAEGDKRDESEAIGTATRWQRATIELGRCDLGTTDGDGYEGEDDDDVDADEDEEASEADDGSTVKVEHWWHCSFDLGTADVDRYEGNNGHDANADIEEQASQANDALTQNVEDWGHSTRECEDWTVYIRPAKYANSKATAIACDVSEAKTES